MKTIVDNRYVEIVLYYKGLLLGAMFDEDALLVALPFICFRFRSGWIRWKSIGNFTLGLLMGSVIGVILVACLIQMYYELIP